MIILEEEIPLKIWIKIMKDEKEKKKKKEKL